MLGDSLRERSMRMADSLSVGQLKDAIRLAWDEIQLSELTALVNTMPKRLVEVIKKGGGVIHY